MQDDAVRFRNKIIDDFKTLQISNVYRLYGLEKESVKYSLSPCAP